MNSTPQILNFTAPPHPEVAILTPLPPLLPWISDKNLSLLLTFSAYWILSGFFHILDETNYLAKYRLHTPEELLKKNRVTKYEVVRDVLLQQLIQTIIGVAMGYTEPDDVTGFEAFEEAVWVSRVFRMQSLLGGGLLRALSLAGLNVNQLAAYATKNMPTVFATAGVGMLGWLGHETWQAALAHWIYWWVIPTVKLLVAFAILDTWQYWMHRTFHEVKWFYRMIHIRHHRLYVPYAFGALYNHPLEGLAMDTIGAAVAYKLAFMTTRGSLVFFTFSTLKTVDDHCGYKLPWDPLQLWFPNNAAYHDIHHQAWGIKTNFSQPFFICWDYWAGTMYTGDRESLRAAKEQKEQQELVNESIQQDFDDLKGDEHTSNGVIKMNGNDNTALPVVGPPMPMLGTLNGKSRRSPRKTNGSAYYPPAINWDAPPSPASTDSEVDLIISQREPESNLPIKDVDPLEVTETNDPRAPRLRLRDNSNGNVERRTSPRKAMVR